MLSSPRRPSSTMRIFSSARMVPTGWLGGYPGPFSPRCPVCACLLVSSWLPNRATMSQESSLTQSGHSVRQALTAYTLNNELPIGGNHRYPVLIGRFYDRFARGDDK